MACKTDKEERFLAVTDKYKDVIAKVCMLYVSQTASFDDLYQETLLNLWQGLDTFRGEAKISTWIYRTAINTCITWHRRSKRHNPDAAISRLGPLDKALISLWLDEKSYDEIALITGISMSNVAVRIHRIKDKLCKMAHEEY